MEAFDFGLDVGGLAVGDGVEVLGRINHHGLADRQPRGSRQSPQRHRYLVSILQQAGYLTAGARMGDGTRELRRERDQERHFLLTEFPVLTLTHHQHAEHLAILNDRNPEKPVVGLFACFHDEQVLRMTGSVIQVDRLLAVSHHADQAPAPVDTHLADGVLAEPSVAIRTYWVWSSSSR